MPRRVAVPDGPGTVLETADADSTATTARVILRVGTVSMPDEEPVPAPAQEEGVTAVGRRRFHIPDTLARGLLTLLLLGLIGWVLLSNVGDLEEVGEALAGV